MSDVTSKIKISGLMEDVNTVTFHYTNSCMVLDGGTNNKGESLVQHPNQSQKSLIRTSKGLDKTNIIFFRGDYRDHVKLWPERCYMTGGGWTSNFGTVGEALGRWGDDGTAYDFGSIMHYR